MAFVSTAKRIGASPISGAVGWTMSATWEAFWLLGPPLGYSQPERRLYLAIGFGALLGFTIYSFWAVLSREARTKREQSDEIATLQAELRTEKDRRPRPRVLVRYLGDGYIEKAPPNRDVLSVWVGNDGTEPALNVRFSVLPLGNLRVRFRGVDHLRREGQDAPDMEIMTANGQPLKDRHTFEWALLEAHKTEPMRGAHTVTSWLFAIQYDDAAGYRYATRYRIELDRFRMHVRFIFEADDEGIGPDKKKDLRQTVPTQWDV